MSAIRLFALLSGLLSFGVQANGVFTGFDKSLAGGQANPVQVGETISYDLTVGCVDTGTGPINGCGTVTITDHVDSAQLENIQVLGLPPGSNVNLTADTPVADVTRVEIEVPNVAGGDSIAVTLRVRVRTDVAVGPTVSNPVAGQTFTVVGTGAPEVTGMGTVDVDINTPTPQWTLTKTQVEPSGPWVVGENVTYRLRLTSDSSSGNVNLTNVEITDMLPAGATFVSATSSGSEMGGTVTWPTFNRNANQGAVDRFVTVRYDGPTFSCNPGVTMVTNNGQADAEHLYSMGPETVGMDDVSTTCTTTPIVDARVSKDNINVPIGPGENREWSVQLEQNNTSNSAMLAPVGFPGPYFQDDIDTTQIEVNRIRTGTWGPVAIQAEIFYSTTAAPATYISLGTVDGDDNTSFTSFVGTVASIRWVFQSDLPAGFDMNSAGRIRFQRTPGATVGTLMNCIDGHWNDGVSDQTAMNCGNVEIEDETVHVTVFKEMDTSSLTPGQQTQISLRMVMREESSDDLINPTIVDLLPPELEFISWDEVNWTGVAAIDQIEPNLEVIENFDADRTLLRFSWRNTAPVGSQTLLGMAGVDNPLTLVDSSDDQEVEIVITVEVAPGTNDDTFTNEIIVFNQTTRNHCQVPPSNSNPDTNDFSETALDLDGDGNTDATGCSGEEGFSVVEAAVLRGTKWDIGTDGLPNIDPNMPGLSPNLSCPERFSGYTRQPCVAQGFNGSTFNYRLELINQGNIQLDEYTLYDILPFVGDTGVSETGSGFPRGSEWQPVLNSVVVPANPLATAEATIEYNMSADPCRAEVSDGPDNIWHGTPGVDCDNNWQANPNTFPNGLDDVRSFRIVAPFASTPWQPGEVMLFDVEMLIPPEAEPGQISWNNFAHRATDQENDIRLATAEPPRVGIMVPLAVDYGDLPDPVAALAGEYPTLKANSGPGHILDEDIYLGECIDNDADGQPNALANGDDGDAGGVDGVAPIGICGSGDDEDGLIPLSLIFEEGQSPNLIANVVNTTGNTATLSCWADYNGDGVLDNGAERGQVTAVSSGPVLVPMPAVPAGTVAATGGGPGMPGDLYVRCRVSTDSKAENPDDGGTFAPADDGEVEDYVVPVYGAGTPPPPIPAEKDWGDNPDALNTLQSSIGPNHGLITDLRLGACVDDEADGQPSTAPASDQDDSAAQATTTYGTCAVANDDEDGINPLQLGLFEGFAPVLDIAVVSPNASFVSCWVDYDGDNAYSNLTEKGTASVPPGASTVQLTMPIVPTGAASATFARCRIASAASDVQYSFGPAATGEVEDYPVTISPTGDLGDLPDTGVGTSAANYQTLLSDSGAIHVLNADGDGNAANDPFLGSCVDSEVDGQPNLAANGDDGVTGAPVLGTCTGNDDEDGVTISALILDQQATLTIVSNQPCTLSAFIDFNANGSLSDAGENLTFVEGAALAGGGIGSPETKTFTVPASATEGVTYARFRCTTDGAVGPTGSASDGEVEDYRVEIFDLMEYGDLPAPYPTLVADNGARHVVANISTNPTLGAELDLESDGAPSVPANGDDIAGSPDDEDGVTIPLLVPGTTQNVIVSYINATASVTKLSAWLDLNGDGTLQQIATDAIVPTAPTGSYTIPVNIPANAAPGNVYARFRFSTDMGLALTGQASDGEVEDYVARIPEVDYGDLPNAYATLQASNGAAHVIDDVNKLGVSVDHDIDGFPGNNADGDDTEAGVAPEEVGDDENGVSFNPMMPGETTDISLTVMGSCYTSVFLDTNGDNSFDALTVAAGSAVGTPGNAPNDMLLAAGTHTLTLNVPANTSGPVYARVRCATVAGEGNVPTGRASGGEVEDYVLMSISNRVFLDDGTGGGLGNNGMQDGGEAGIPSVLLQLVQSGVVIATDVTDGAGNYEFPGLEPGTYKVQIAASNFGPGQVLDGLLSSTGMGDPNANNEENVDENGMDDGNPAVNGIMSGDVILVLGNAPTGNDTNSNTNDTVDFGLVLVDYGDNPDSFGTTGPGGARHILDGKTFLGAGVDDDNDGSPTVSANGDDTVADDEDGVNFLTPMNPGGKAAIEVKANGEPNSTVYLTAWVDFDANDSFAGADQVFTDEPIVLDGTGMANPMLMFDVPVDANGDLYSRFRLTAAPGQVTSPTNLAASGEVEDYVMLSLGNRVWMDMGINGVFYQGDDMPLEDVIVELEFPDGSPVVDANGVQLTDTTDVDGLYRFIGLPAGDYRVRVPASEFAIGQPLFEKRPTESVVEMDPDGDEDEGQGHNALPTVLMAMKGSPTGVVTLQIGSEPTTEDGNPNTNLTVDLAYRDDVRSIPTMSVVGLLMMSMLLFGIVWRRRQS